MLLWISNGQILIKYSVKVYHLAGLSADGGDEKSTHPPTRLEVLTTVKMSMLVFWAVTPCRLVDRYQRFSPEDGDYVSPKRCCLQVHTEI
jgi:hypothetical protein